jgi:PPOX class probable F420-dependent enzyme
LRRLPNELRELIESGPLTHLTTINPDGSPQVTVIWIGLDDDPIVSGHMHHHKKLNNIERDPRVVLSFPAQRDHGVVMNPYAVLRARAKVEPSDAGMGAAQPANKALHVAGQRADQWRRTVGPRPDVNRTRKHAETQ